MVELNDLKGLFQPKWFCDSVIGWDSESLGPQTCFLVDFLGEQFMQNTSKSEAALSS